MRIKDVIYQLMRIIFIIRIISLEEKLTVYLPKRDYNKRNFENKKTVFRINGIWINSYLYLKIPST